MNIDKHKDKLISRLRDKEHRDAFVSAYIQIGIPFQIRALREQRGWTQKELADQTGVNQAWISQVENPNYQGFSLKTLLKLASAFDIGLIVRFAPFSELVKWELTLSPDKLKAESFDKESYFREASISAMTDIQYKLQDTDTNLVEVDFINRTRKEPNKINQMLRSEQPELMRKVSIV